MNAPRLFGHPLHPITTHFPIGILLLSAACDVGRLLTSDDRWSERALFLLIAGLISSIPTVLSGLVELLDFDEDAPSLMTLMLHMVSASIALAAFGVSLGLRLTSDEVNTAAYIASGAGVLALLLTGRFGGNLVFSFGHGVEHGTEYSIDNEGAAVNNAAVNRPVRNHAKETK